MVPVPLFYRVLEHAYTTDRSMAAFLYLGIFGTLALGMALFAFQQLSVIARNDRVVLVSSQVGHVEKPFLKVIKKYLASTDDMNFVEIGAGYAKITRIAATSFQWKSIIAVELDFFAVFVSRLKNRWKKLPITFIKSDIFDYAIPTKSVVYSYMSVPVMNRLLENNAFENCLVLSLTFAFDGVEPTDEYQVKGFQKRLYVYDFRK